MGFYFEKTPFFSLKLCPPEQMETRFNRTPPRGLCESKQTLGKTSSVELVTTGDISRL